MSELVSVLIPAYNHAAYIQSTVNSILDQTYQELELIIVDDGSTDGTADRIAAIEVACHARFKRFVVIKQANQGVIPTLNKLLSLAEGKFVYLIASDDRAHPQAIEKLVEFLSNHDDYALVVGDNEFIDETGRVGYWDRSHNLVYERSAAKHLSFGSFLKCKERGDAFGSYMMLFAANHVPNGYLVRKSIFDQTGPYSALGPLEDWYIHLQIAKYSKLKYLDEVLFQYRWHGANTAKRTEHMKALTRATLANEYRLLRSLDPADLSAQMQDCISYGQQKSVLKADLLGAEIRKVKNPERRGFLLRIRNLDFLLSFRRSNRKVN